jgi:hypothetical protein
LGNAFVGGLLTRLPLSIESRVSVSMKRLILVADCARKARVNRPLTKDRGRPTSRLQTTESDFRIPRAAADLPERHEIQPGCVAK